MAEKMDRVVELADGEISGWETRNYGIVITVRKKG
jgi:hypothetical protein